MLFSENVEPAKVYLKTITPDEAKLMLTHNYSKQRKIKKNNVERFTQDIKAGKWNPYRGDLVRVSSDGALIDGQHRLEACIKANMPIQVLYMEGYDNEEFRYFDAGISRTGADALAGTPHALTAAAFVRAVTTYERYGLEISRYAGTHTSISNTAIAEKYKPEYEEYISLGEKLNKVNAGGSKAAYAFFFWLADQADTKLAATLRADLLEELTIEPATALFRKTLNQRYRNHGRLDLSFTLNLLVKTWNAYFEGKTPKRFQGLNECTGVLKMDGLNVKKQR